MCLSLMQSVGKFGRNPPALEHSRSLLESSCKGEQHLEKSRANHQEYGLRKPKCGMAQTGLFLAL